MSSDEIGDSQGPAPAPPVVRHRSSRTTVWLLILACVLLGGAVRYVDMLRQKAGNLQAELQAAKLGNVIRTEHIGVAQKLLSQPDSHIVHLADAQGHGTASATLLWNQSSPEGILFLNNLPDRSADQPYRLMARRGDEAPIELASFHLTHAAIKLHMGTARDETLRFSIETESDTPGALQLVPSDSGHNAR